MSDWKQFTVGELMNNLHITAKEHDESIDPSELSQKQRASRQKDLLTALAQTTDYSYSELNDMLEGMLDEVSTDDIDELEKEQAEGVGEDQQRKASPEKDEVREVAQGMIDALGIREEDE